MIAWLERWGERFLKASQPDIYQMLLLHVGGTDVLRLYSGKEAYWQNVQVILDCFFSSAERAEMSAELINEPLFLDDAAFIHFLHQARAEIRCREIVAVVDETVGIGVSLRSVN